MWVGVGGLAGPLPVDRVVLLWWATTWAERLSHRWVEACRKSVDKVYELSWLVLWDLPIWRESLARLGSECYVGVGLCEVSKAASELGVRDAALDGGGRRCGRRPVSPASVQVGELVPGSVVRAGSHHQQ